MEKVKVEIQYFLGCPNVTIMIKNVKEAIAGMEDKIDYSEILIEDGITAEQIGFRGSPTLIIDDKDFEGLEKPDCPGLSCRFYKHGVPPQDKIRQKINELL